MVSPERVRLEALAKSVEAITDFKTRVVQRGDQEFLHVVNPMAGHLSEDISCCAEEFSGDLWFFWSWNDTIGPADDPDGVAQALKRVLTHKV